MTITQIAVMYAVGSDLFDAICHTFATLSTGGFSTTDASIADATVAQQYIMAAFIVLAEINFGIFHLLINDRDRQALADKELRLYLAILLVGSIAIAWNLFNQHMIDHADVHGSGETLRKGLIQTVSILTSTGFCVTDFDQWIFPA